MPMISIQSLPFSPPLDMPHILASLTRELAQQCQLPARHISIDWQYFNAHHYSEAGLSSATQPAHSHAIKVQILVADAFSPNTLQHLMTQLAKSLSHLTPIETSNLFIQGQRISGQHIFDHGQFGDWQSWQDES